MRQDLIDDSVFAMTAQAPELRQKGKEKNARDRWCVFRTPRNPPDFDELNDDRSSMSVPIS